MSDSVEEIVQEPTPEPVKQEKKPVAKEPADRTFTQEQVDAFVSKARSEGREAAYRYVGEQLGVPVYGQQGVDLTDLKGLIKIARDQQSVDAERIQSLESQLGELSAQVTERQTLAERNHALAQQAVRRGKAEALAVQLGFQDPNDAVAFVQLDGLDVDLDTMSVSGLEEALKQVAEQKPYLLKQAVVVPEPDAPPIPPTPKSAGTPDRADVDAERQRVLRDQARTFF